MSIKYYSAKETAAMIRKHLKQQFPKVKFSVNSREYAGGSAVDIRWIDGPTQQHVQNVCQQFNGVNFDSSQDLKSYDESGHTSYIMPHRSFSADFLSRRADRVCERYHVDRSLVTIKPLRDGTAFADTTCKETFNTFYLDQLINKEAHKTAQA